MSEERRQVLQMLQDGKLTADQAMELLAVLEANDEPEPVSEEAVSGEIITPSASPDMERFRRFWQIPFFITLSILLLSGLWLRSLYQDSGGAITFWFVCMWSIFMLSFILTALAFLSRRAAWAHVRIYERSGRRIAISLPLPLRLASWGLHLVRPFVQQAEQGKLEMASAFITAARENLQRPGGEPLVISVDDNDGDRVQVYIG